MFSNKILYNLNILFVNHSLYLTYIERNSNKVFKNKRYPRIYLISFTLIVFIKAKKDRQYKKKYFALKNDPLEKVQISTNFTYVKLFVRKIFRKKPSLTSLIHTNTGANQGVKILVFWKILCTH